MGSTQLVSVPFALYSQGLIITDENGQSHLVTVDTNGTLSTNQVIVNCGDNFTDLRDGKTYGTVKIGSQCWMSENLNYGQMVLSTVTPSNNGIVEKYCFNDQELSCITTGGYYLWDEAMQYSTDSLNQGICVRPWAWQGGPACDPQSSLVLKEGHPVWSRSEKRFYCPQRFGPA